jgi:hypothetical protein
VAVLGTHTAWIAGKPRQSPAPSPAVFPQSGTYKRTTRALKHQDRTPIDESAPDARHAIRESCSYRLYPCNAAVSRDRSHSPLRSAYKCTEYGRVGCQAEQKLSAAHAAVSAACPAGASATAHAATPMAGIARPRRTSGTRLRARRRQFLCPDPTAGRGDCTATLLVVSSNDWRRGDCEFREDDEARRRGTLDGRCA